MKPKLWIVVPCFNESEVLPITSELLLQQLVSLKKENLIDEDSSILFVDDGSSDNTYSIISQLSAQDSSYKGIRLSRNRGHQNALLAGLMESVNYADITISADADGQDDMSVIKEMVLQYNQGNDIVYGVRNNRESDSPFKRLTAQSFYKIMEKMGVETVYNHADFRLLSRKVLQSLQSYKEVNLYLRGLIPLIGFKSSIVYYSRNERVAGKSHYPLKKMMALAVDGITSLSLKPLSLIFMFGIVVMSLAFVFAIIALVKKQMVVALILMNTLLIGMLFIAVGVVGQYVGKTYLETKHRPRYIISERTYEDGK